MAIGNVDSVLILDGVDQVCETLLKGAGIKVTINTTKLTKEQLLQEVKIHDAVIVRSATKITSEVLLSTDRLKIVGRAGTGVDNIDVDAATRRGVLVMNTPGGNTLSAAEHTCAMICALSRSIPQACASLKTGAWDRKAYMGNELYGKTLSIVGLGRIGREVAKRMQSFGMTTIGFDPIVSKEEAAKCGIELLSLDEIWPRSDYITVHTPLLPHTRNLIGKESLKKCKNGVKIVNVARGGIVDESALLEALNVGTCSGAALDVFEQEPPTNLKLLQHSKLICTPHLGANTKEAQTRVAEEIGEQLIDMINGRPLVGVINAPALTNALNDTNKPWINLTQSLGCLTSRLQKDDNFDDIDIKINLFGEVKNMKSFLGSSFLEGLLKGRKKGVNLVNSGLLAKECGVKLVIETPTSSLPYPAAPSDSVQVQLLEKGNVVHSFLGSAIGGQPTLFALDGCTWESGLTLGRHMLFFRSAPAVCPLADIASKLKDSSLTSLLSSSGSKEGSDVCHVARTTSEVTPMPKIPNLHLLAQVSF